MDKLALCSQTINKGTQKQNFMVTLFGEKINMKLTVLFLTLCTILLFVNAKRHRDLKPWTKKANCRRVKIGKYASYLINHNKSEGNNRNQLKKRLRTNWCGKLSIANGKVTFPCKRGFGQIAKYSCNKGYNLQPKKYKRRQCLGNHIWSGQEPICIADLPIRSSANHQITFQSHCSSEIWVGILENAGSSPPPEEGGVKLGPYETKTIDFLDGWSGRAWARTGCGSGRCETGDCNDGKLKCNGTGGKPPATLAEFTFGNLPVPDFYDVSVKDGFNVQVAMSPKDGTYQPGNGTYYCTRAGCSADINAICPNEQMKIYGSSDEVVACKSACYAYDTDRFCCRGNYSTPATCPPYPLSLLFKHACPKAYSYAFDDPTSTFTCRSKVDTKTSYTVEFC